MFEPFLGTSEIIDNLMKFLFFKLYEKEMTITEFRMQKLIFKIKMELGKNHMLFDKLPYYWYFHGPFSEVVRDSFRDISANHCNSKYNSFILKEGNDDFENNDLLSSYPVIKKITNNILNNKTEFYNNLIESIYMDYAPYPLMHSFKYVIYKSADENRTSQNFDVEKYISTFYECETQLPEDEYFNDFSDIYSQLLTNLDLINDEGMFDDCWLFLRDPIKELWETFASGLRVIFKDNYYDYKEYIWHKEFRDKVNTLSILVNKTEQYTNGEFKPIQYNSSERDILNSTIGTYLRR